MSLSVRYGDDVPPALAAMVEHHAKAEGLSLAALELVGASLDFAERFIVACENGEGHAFCEALGVVPPTETVARARWVAQRLFG